MAYKTDCVQVFKMESRYLNYEENEARMLFVLAITVPVHYSGPGISC